MLLRGKPDERSDRDWPKKRLFVGGRRAGGKSYRKGSKRADTQTAATWEKRNQAEVRKSDRTTKTTKGKRKIPKNK